MRLLDVWRVLETAEEEAEAVAEDVEDVEEAEDMAYGEREAQA